MIPFRVNANGIPWLYWLDDGAWECEACGESGKQERFTSVEGFARWAGDVRRAHARCDVGGSIDESVEIGHVRIVGRMSR